MTSCGDSETNYIYTNKKRFGRLSIVAGSKYWSKGGQRIYVKNFTAHEDYTEYIGLLYRRTNDVGVLLLTQPLEYNSEVQPIDIATKYRRMGDRASVSGWVRTKFNLKQKLAEDLRCLEVTITRVLRLNLKHPLS